MKVGTLNYHNVYNYGALLQSYALKRFLTECGYEVFAVNYTPPLYYWQREGNVYFDSFKESFYVASGTDISEIEAKLKQ